jgi:transposase
LAGRSGRPRSTRWLLAYFSDSHDRLDPAGFARMLTWLDAGDPEGEVGAAYLAKELLRDTYLADDALEARRRLVTFYDHCTSSEVSELERLARTITRWEAPILRWHRTRLTNAATEGTNLVIKEHHAARLRVPERRQLPAPAPVALRRPMATSTGRINTTPPTTRQRAEPAYWACCSTPRPWWPRRGSW